MKPKIGFRVYNIYFEGEGKIDFDTLEIMSTDKGILFNIKHIIKAKKFLKKKNLSMHSQTSRVFSCKKIGFKEFNLAEINVIKAEIILCKILGAKELIVHLKQEKLSKQEEKIFLELINFSKKNKVEIIYESNGFFSAKTCLDVLKRFPTLNYNLDLGHLNTAIGNKTLGMDVYDFIEKVKKRVVYIHAHNNNGIDDEHKGLDEGTLDWKKILDMLDLTKVKKIIIEARAPEEIKETKELLENYLKGVK